MKNTCFFYIAFQVLKVILIKVCKIQPPDLLFLVVFISFYISRYHFSQFCKTLFNNIWKKDFRHKFSFFNGFTQIPHPLNSKNPLSVTNIFCWCTLSHLFYMLLINLTLWNWLIAVHTRIHLHQKLLTFLLSLGYFKSIFSLSKCKLSFKFVLILKVKVSTLFQNWKLRSRTQLATCTERKSFNRNHYQQSYTVDQSNPILLYFFTPLPGIFRHFTLGSNDLLG